MDSATTVVAQGAHAKVDLVAAAAVVVVVVAPAVAVAVAVVEAVFPANSHQRAQGAGAWLRGLHSHALRCIVAHSFEHVVHNGLWRLINCVAPSMLCLPWRLQRFKLALQQTAGHVMSFAR